MWDVISFLKKKERPTEIRHIAITLKGTIKWMQKENKGFEDVFSERYKFIQNIIELMVTENIPIVSVYLEDETMCEDEDCKRLVESLKGFFEKLYDDGALDSSKIKVSVIGKWYNLPGMVIESIKSIIEKTKDYDSFFLNFCINYDGREEIIDSFKILADSFSSNKEQLTKEHISGTIIKENTYSSYFVPPDIIIETGPTNRFSGILLLDSIGARIHFIKKFFPEIGKEEITRIIDQ